MLRILPFIILLAATGCGPSVGDITGTVTHQKKPVAGATITFYDDANGAVSSEIKEDGSYTVANVRAGAAKIAVVAPMAITAPGQPAPKKLGVPTKYADREKSGLTFQVKPGANSHNIELD